MLLSFLFYFYLCDWVGSIIFPLSLRKYQIPTHNQGSLACCEAGHLYVHQTFSPSISQSRIVVERPPMRWWTNTGAASSPKPHSKILCEQEGICGAPQPNTTTVGSLENMKHGSAAVWKENGILDWRRARATGEHGCPGKPSAFCPVSSRCCLRQCVYAPSSKRKRKIAMPAQPRAHWKWR